MEERSFEAQFGFWKIIGASLENSRGSGELDLQFGGRGGS
jgi:hypothetical protein